MSEKKYDWLRFWTPRDGKVAVNGYGALEDPQGEYGHILNPAAKTLEALADIQCLALLGEPGSGKSEEFKHQVEVFSAAHPADLVLPFQLRDYQTDLKLCNDIFDNNPTFQTWVQGDQKLYLYLDSLDEGLLTISTLANLLVREFRKYPADRLYLRIACRTAEWPTTLTTGIQEHWGEEGFKAYELLPLRVKDIEEAVRSEGIDSGKFFEELAQKLVGPLAIKPVTLKFLTGLFLKHAAFPQTQAELYAEGCRYLCEEWNQSRRDSHRKGKLTTAQKFLVAQRIAAISIFANRNTVWMGPLAGLPSGDVAIEELTSGSEGTGSERFHVGEEEIRETLSTGLFTSRGPDRMGWAHQTYAEFLAARYLHEHKFTFGQKIGLIAHAEDAGGMIIPQLRETAAWLASSDKETFQWILRIDPVTLLRTDVTSVDSDDRSALVNRLLETANNEEWIDRDWSLHGTYSKLKHPGLADQLSPYVRDKRMGTFARRLATDIAEACEVRSLQDDLTDLALDPGEDIHLRVNAAYAVVRIGDSETKRRLRPLATGEVGDDPDDELKGRGLRALWPDHISSDELFPLLTYPKRPSLYGSYKSFLDALARESETIDVARALTWLRNQHPDPGSPFRSLRNAILRRAWQSADASVSDVLADLIVNNIRKLRGDNRETFDVDDDKRREVLYLAIQRLAQMENPLWYSLSYENRLVSAVDLPWLLNQLQSEKSIQAQKLTSEIIARMLDWANTDHVGLIIETSAHCPVLAETFRLFLNPVYLDSEQADAQRKAFAKSLEVTREEPEPPPLDPPASERVQRALKKFEEGDTASWWKLNLQMTLQNDGYWVNEHESDLTRFPGWQAATADTKQRFIDGAKKYLHDGDPEPNEWINKDLIWRPAYAGYRAFRLLLNEDPEYLSSLSSTVWEKWACILVSYQFQHEQSEAEIQARLVTLAFQHASGEVIRVVLLLIDKEDKKDGFLSVLSVLRDCWDKALCAALTLKFKNRRLKDSSLAKILSELLERDVEEAKRHAEVIVKRKPSSPKGYARWLKVARVLLTHANDAGWKVVWPRIKKNREFGRQLIESVAGSAYRRETAIPERLDEEQLAELFFWLAREYPYVSDPRHEGVYSPGPEDEARRFRDSVLHHLKERGTARAIAALESLVNRIPELEWLKWTLTEARETNRRRTWAPVRPSDILSIAEDKERRLVQSGEQLINVVIESLRRLQEKLHGETPAVRDLWDKVKSGIYRPIAENDLSNYVKRHFDYDLKERGIIANREVQIRQTEGTFKGQNTDILIDAITRDSRGEISDQITLIIETKGNWNRELDQAMDTQLKNRYLKDNQSRFGLYLVGWFNCAQWDKGDARKNRCAKIARNEAQEKFDSQAATLSADGATLKAFVDTALSS
jgi:hypothetical protein